MAIVFCDGMDSYAATADLSKKWGTIGTAWAWSSSAGRSGGGAMVATTTGGTYLAPIGTLISANPAMQGFWLKISAAPAARSILLQPITSASSIATPVVMVETTGRLSMCNASLSALITGTINVCDNNWHWVEIYWFVGSNGLTKGNVDGIVEWNGSFTYSGSGPADRLMFQSIANRTVTIDDPIFWDDNGAAPVAATFPLGPRQITTVRPQADGVVGFLTATGAGTHFNQINEVNADGDTTYVESAVSNDQDLYDFAAMGISPATFTAVVANAYVENPNPGVINFKQIAKSSATQTDGTSVQAPSFYFTKQQVFPLDPNTAAAWASASAVDNATFGIKVV